MVQVKKCMSVITLSVKIIAQALIIIDKRLKLEVNSKNKAAWKNTDTT